jgi:hypothetical protein
MTHSTKATQAVSWILGIPVFIIGLLFLFLVHPVPGIIAILVSLIYLPQVNVMLLKKFGFQVPLALKIFLVIAILWFTLGVSDLGDMFDRFVNSL